MPGSVVINDKEFNNLQVRYDIYNDELLTITDRGIIIQLNKEMIDFFSMEYNNKVFHFKNIDADSLSSLSGYVNVLYDGKTPLYVKYRKEILLLAVENKYDLFNQINKIYLQKYGKFIQINSKKEFLGILKDQKQQVHNFIKTNNIRISKKNPESFKPVIEYYDKLRQ
jgi:predicted nucleotide-binding protein